MEFTESIKDLDKIREAICAFANDLPAHGKPGFIFIGIRDDKSCADLKIDDKLSQTLGGLRSDGKILPFPSMNVTKRTLNGCEVAVIQVEPSDNPPIKVDGRCWIRVGPRRAQATAEEERLLTEKRRWGNLLYDAQRVSGASIDNDLDMRKFENEYLPSAVSPEVLEENDRNQKDQLRALRLITQDGTPTVTAILMLGKEPNYWFPGAYIQFVRYEGNEVTDAILNSVSLFGSLPDQLREVDRLLKLNISTALNTHGERHIEEPDYPFAALRELVRNAVIHRNYEHFNAPVRVTWFVDSVEICSPGSAYGAVNRENFGKPGATDYRNPTIAEAIRNLGFMQKFGIGIAKARKVLEENGNPQPGFYVGQNFVFVKVKKQQGRRGKNLAGLSSCMDIRRAWAPCHCS